MPITIPQTDPRASYLEHRGAIDRAIQVALESGRYILGDEVKRFEQEFAAFNGARHAVGVGSGTDALVLALRALDVGPGDTVATVAHTAVATVAAIELVGAHPLLLDVDPVDFTLDVAELADVLKRGARIKAIVPVHLYGHPARIDDLLGFARDYGLRVIEDCAQAHGATIGGRTVGTLGDVGCFSFYPTKNLGAFGDGGAVITNDEALARRVVELREYGWRERYVSATAGQNSRLDELQAAILRVKLATLPRDNQRRQALAAHYDAGLAGTPLATPARRAGVSHVFHQYVVRAERRESLRAALAAAGIGTAVHYPVPVHRQPAYAGRIAVGPAAMRHTEPLAKQVLSLPMYPQLPGDAVKQVIAAVHAAGPSR
ncbi:MAG: DegT/DnrJ/EryC1/StrS family aminotransferase [Alphaproteobacteria bacterium]|nr:DegT/DnrJ/EryC1/StrS family aminotransferase [Alphaproteobacteria bacterium]